MNSLNHSWGLDLFSNHLMHEITWMTMITSTHLSIIFYETFVTNQKTTFISSPRFGMITINFNSKHLDVQGD